MSTSSPANTKTKRKRGPVFPDGPPFKIWVLEHWQSLLCYTICNAFALIFYFEVPLATDRYFPVVYHGSKVIWPQFAYPEVAELIPTWMSALGSFFIPFAFIGLTSMFLVGSYWDADAAIMGLSTSLSITTLFQSIVKIVIGGLRPNFYVICNPHQSQSPRFTPGEGYGRVFHTVSVCTGDSFAVKDALMSFPSGHSAAAFAGFVFLALYINAKFKVFAAHYTTPWPILLFTAPILGAVLVASSKIIDYRHHWYDVVAGALIGTFFAVISYRSVYMAVLDWRYNHVPLKKWSLEKRSGGGASFDPFARPEPVRDLTAINFAGWRNRYSKEGLD